MEYSIQLLVGEPIPIRDVRINGKVCFVCKNTLDYDAIESNSGVRGCSSYTALGLVCMLHPNEITMHLLFVSFVPSSQATRLGWA